MERRELGLREVGFKVSSEAEQLHSDLGLGREHAVHHLSENLRGFETELLADRPVTFYSTYIAPFQGRLRIGKAPFIHSERALIASQIDPAEGEGLVVAGWRKLENSLVERFIRGEQAVYLYISPRGRAGNCGEYAHITYPYHAAYLGVLSSSGEIRNWALKMEIPESVLRDWVNTIAGGNLITDLRRESFLVQPQVVGPTEGVYTPHQLLDVLRGVLESYSLTSLYTTREGVKVGIDDLKAMMLEEKRPSLLVQTAAAVVAERLRTRGTLTNAYLRETIQDAYFYLLESYARNGIVEVSGCTGKVDLRRFRTLYPTPPSTATRLAEALMPPLATEGDEYGSLTFQCPHCKMQIIRPYGQLIKICPHAHCGKDVSC